MAYLAQSTFAMARAPIRVPAVGYRQLEKPSPNWKAWTATCLVMPTRSAMGTIKGITAAAWPDPDGIRKLISRLAMNMKFAPITDPMLEIGMESQLTMVFRIWPWDRITPMPLANPTINAALVILAQPFINSFVVPLTPIPLSSPQPMASTKKVAAI